MVLENIFNNTANLIKRLVIEAQNNWQRTKNETTVLSKTVSLILQTVERCN